MKQFTIYGNSRCSFCVKATELLNEKGIEFDYIDIDEGDNKFHLLSLADDYNVVMKTVPQIFAHVETIGDEYVGGYDDLVALLGAD